MKSVTSWPNGARLLPAIGLLVFATTSTFGQGFAQNGGDGRGGSPRTAKAAAPVDFTGYWAAIVVEDWRYRMLPPEKYTVKPPLGARVDIPMNAEARKIALAWDPAKDEAAGERCAATEPRTSCESQREFTSPGRTIKR